MQDEHDEEAAMDDRDIALLPLVDHSGVKYRQFRKNILKVCCLWTRGPRLW